MAKQKPHIVKGSDPTEEEMRKESGLSKKEVKQVCKILKDVWKKKVQKARKKNKKIKK